MNANPEDGRRSESSGRGTTTRGGARKRLEVRSRQYLVAPTDPGIDEQGLAQRLARIAERSGALEIVRTIPSRAMAGPPVAVVRMKPEQVAIVSQSAGGALWAEQDAPLQLASAATMVSPAAATAAYALGEGFTANIQVLNEDEQPLEQAEVQIVGRHWTAQGFTGSDGKVELTLHGELPETAAELLVRPRAGAWGLWKQNPNLRADAVNTVILRTLPEPKHPAWGSQASGAQAWAAQAMGFDGLPSECDGAGIKIALIDTGVATTHGQLRDIRHGTDATRGEQPSWSQDPIGHGTQSAGILAATQNGNGVRGYAPEAELHVFKLPLDACCSDLVAALDNCIQTGVDLVCLGYGCERGSAIVEQRIAAAKERGIAVIAPAGNSGGRVQFPASSMNALAVGAIGSVGTFPDDSLHAAQALTSESVGGGLFVPAFSCYGPELDVCAPGVAVITCQSPDGYAACDGTSLAAAHVTALAALVLAHHFDFQHQFAMPTAMRVERLFQILKQTAQPLADPWRTGTGLPYAPRALGLQSHPRPYTPPLDFGLGQMRQAIHQADLWARGRFEAPQALRGPAAVAHLPLNFVPPVMMGTPSAPVGMNDLKAAMQRAGLSTGC